MELSILHSDHAVLQRNAPIRISGSGAGRIGISFIGRHYEFEVGDGEWSVELDAAEAGGPYEMQLLINGEPRTLHDLYIGDVYLCGGQSNMEIVLDKCYCDKGALSDDPLIRCFELQTTTTDFEWRLATRENALKMTAIGYYFASMAREKGVAVGIISCNRGATSAESWIERELLVRRGLFISDEEKKERGLLFYPYNRCGELYSLLFSRIRDYSMLACLFYQGESNASHPHSPSYSQLLELLIDSWRERLRAPSLPFFLCELCNFGWYGNGKINFAEVREHQRRVIRKKRGDGVYYVTMTDLGEADDIHPRRKKQVAERLWLAVRNEIFGEPCEYCGPFAERVIVEGDFATVCFSHARGMRSEGPVRSIEAKGMDGAPLEILSCEIKDNTLAVKASGEIKTLLLFYRNYPQTNIFNEAGFPATGARYDVTDG